MLHLIRVDIYKINFQSVQFSHSVVPDSFDPMDARLPCPSPTPGACSDSCPSSWWCHPTISSSVIPFSSHLQSFLASRSFLMSQLSSSCGQSIGASASASVFPMNIQSWFPLGLSGLISLCNRREKGRAQLLKEWHSPSTRHKLLRIKWDQDGRQTKPWSQISKWNDTPRGAVTVPSHCLKTMELAVAQILETSAPSQK